MELDEAKTLLEADKKARQEQFVAELGELLKKFNVDLVPTINVQPK